MRLGQSPDWDTKGKKNKQTGVCKQPMKSFSRASQTVLLYLADARSFLHSLYQKHPLSSLYYFCWCWWLIHISGLTPTDGGLTGSFASDSRIHLFSHNRGTIQQLPPHPHKRAVQDNAHVLHRQQRCCWLTMSHKHHKHSPGPKHQLKNSFSVITGLHPIIHTRHYASKASTPNPMQLN